MAGAPYGHNATAGPTGPVAYPRTSRNFFHKIFPAEGTDVQVVRSLSDSRRQNIIFFRTADRN
ncbi:hypothetical protein D1821_05830 [Phaeobacter inhibens]|nr:hypothetical protein D1821_05830 [Phaeobacter inhibens]